jgi:hypothetical protein
MRQPDTIITICTTLEGNLTLPMKNQSVFDTGTLGAYRFYCYGGKRKNRCKFKKKTKFYRDAINQEN